MFVYSVQGICVYSDNVCEKKRATNVATRMHSRVTRDRTRRLVCALFSLGFQTPRFDSSLGFSSALILTTTLCAIDRLNMNEEQRSFFCAGRWKHARIFAIIRLVFEVVGFFMLIGDGDCGFKVVEIRFIAREFLSSILRWYRTSHWSNAVCTDDVDWI